MGFLVDKDDSSVTRSDKYFRELFKRCNYELFLVEVRSPPSFNSPVRAVAKSQPSLPASLPCPLEHCSAASHGTARGCFAVRSSKRASPKSCSRCACTRSARSRRDTESRPRLFYIPAM